MGFPRNKFTSIVGYLDAYLAELQRAWVSVSREKLALAEGVLTAAIERGAQIFACGNGGSAAIANHLACDHLKGIRTDTLLRPRVLSLSENMALITAIGNDLSFEEVFAFQLASLARPGDVLVTVSVSGDSENIVRAVDWACEHNISTIALTGFGGGRSARKSDVNIHVGSENYGVVEDVHQSLMHVLAQYIRQCYMQEELLFARKF
jgi:D-sedoheptulose 7-phosphate isomerase